MADVTVYYNPSCSKCRQAVALLSERHVDHERREDPTNPPDRAELKRLMTRLGTDDPRTFVRAKESAYTELGLADAGPDAVLDALVSHPGLLERPIVVCGDRAVVARPPERLLELLPGVTLRAEVLPCLHGRLLAVVDGESVVVRTEFLAAGASGVRSALSSLPEPAELSPGCADRFAGQLRGYLAGRRRDFDLEIAPRGTPFQHAVWDAMLAIPYGETRTYGQLARRLGRPAAARAVGRASATNPIPILIPCHRMVGHDGALTGFGGGLRLKAALLALERGAQQTLERT